MSLFVICVLIFSYFLQHNNFKYATSDRNEDHYYLTVNIL